MRVYNLIMLSSFKKYLSLPWLEYLFPVTIFISIVLSYSEYIPIWDSRAYFDFCIFPGITVPFNLMSFNCVNHGSLTFGLLYSTLQYIDFGNVLFIHLTSLFLMTTAFWFFYLILQLLFRERLWITIGMLFICLNPVVIANVLNPTPDLTVFAFSIMCLWGFLTHRLTYAMLFGIAIIFSKESGFIYYGLCFSYYLLLYSNPKGRWKSYFCSILILSLPLLLFALFMWCKTYISGGELLFQNIQLSDLFKKVVNFSLYDTYFYSVLSTIFVLNFQWIITFIIILAIPKYLLLIIKSIKNNKTKEIKLVLFIGLTTLSLCYILTRFPVVLNARYYLLIFPLTSILFLYAINIFPRHFSILLSTIIIFLLLFSCFRTIDPVSKMIYGTFTFGQNKLLKMTSFNDECCGYGRDQLIYNLEHTQIGLLLNQFSQKVRLSRNDILLSDPLASFFVYANINNDDYKWTFKNKNSHKLNYAGNPAELNKRIEHINFSRIFYPRFPYIKSDDFEAEILKYFKPIKTIEVKNANYSMTYVEYESRIVRRK